MSNNSQSNGDFKVYLISDFYGAADKAVSGRFISGKGCSVHWENLPPNENLIWNSKYKIFAILNRREEGDMFPTKHTT